MRFILLFIVAAIIISSCRPTRKIQTAIAKKDTLATNANLPTHADSVMFMDSILSRLVAKKIDFTTFSAKINVDYVDAEDKSYNVNAFVRMYKDSAIWVSVNAIFGIEALRALITRDSVKILDKQNKVYTARAVEYLQEVTALPLDLRSIQDIILGNPVFIEGEKSSYTNNNETVSVLIIGNLFKNLVTLQAGSNQILRSKLDDTDVTRNRTGDLTYSDYENKGGFDFATKRKITMAEKKKLDIKLEYKQVDFNESLTFPFSIPKNYTQQ